MRHLAGQTHERADAAQTFAEREIPERRDQRRGFLRCAVELERDHAAKARHLPPGDVMTRMG